MPRFVKIPPDERGVGTPVLENCDCPVDAAGHCPHQNEIFDAIDIIRLRLGKYLYAEGRMTTDDDIAYPLSRMYEAPEDAASVASMLGVELPQPKKMIDLYACAYETDDDDVPDSGDAQAFQVPKDGLPVPSNPQEVEEMRRRIWSYGTSNPLDPNKESR